MQRIQENEKVKWISINGANKEILKFAYNSRWDRSNVTQANAGRSQDDKPAILMPIVDLASKARSVIRELDPIVS